MACKQPEKFYPAVKSPLFGKDGLKGKVAFITGGGTGLGKAMALAMASRGAKVAIASRRIEVLETAADEILKLTGQKVLPIQMNVKSGEDVKKAADICEEKLGLPNVIVNNAAGNFIQATERLSFNAFRTIIEIVLLGTANVTLEFGKRLIKKNQGASFISISAPYAMTGTPFVVPSAAAKAGVENLTKSLAAEWGKFGLRFNVISPGNIYTEGASSRLDPTGERATKAESRIPAGRIGKPEELANLACYLASDYSSWMNGSILLLDGGMTRFQGSSRNDLHNYTHKDWENIENTIRNTTGKSKL